MSPLRIELLNGNTYSREGEVAILNPGESRDVIYSGEVLRCKCLSSDEASEVYNIILKAGVVLKNLKTVPDDQIALIDYLRAISVEDGPKTFDLGKTEQNRGRIVSLTHIPSSPKPYNFRI